jgi:hypothetical protein
MRSPWWLSGREFDIMRMRVWSRMDEEHELRVTEVFLERYDGGLDW